MITKEQREENIKKWVEALRSGKYEQGVGYLCKDGNYCCLGVACDLFADHKVKINNSIVYDGNYYTMPPSVMKKLGLTEECGQYDENSLSYLNDHDEYTFEQIADLIESRPTGLFVDTP